MATTRKRRAVGRRLTLFGISWKMYTRVLRTFVNRRLRITYDQSDINKPTKKKPKGNK